MPPFLKLPIELRDQIYTLILHQGHTITTQADDFIHQELSLRKALSLTRVNHQIREEALKIFYSIHDFWFGTTYLVYPKIRTRIGKGPQGPFCKPNPSPFLNIHAWLITMESPYWKHIRRVSIDLGHCRIDSLADTHTRKIRAPSIDDLMTKAKHGIDLLPLAREKIYLTARLLDNDLGDFKGPCMAINFKDVPLHNERGALRLLRKK